MSGSEIPVRKEWLPCGHYTMGKFPFQAIAGLKIRKFLIQTRSESGLFVGVFCFDLQLCLAAFANPMMLAFDKGVIVDALAVIGSARCHTSFFLGFNPENTF